MVLFSDNRRHAFPSSSQASDYGGDFTQEEEELLGSLLTQYSSHLPPTSAISSVSANARINVNVNAGVVPHSSPRSFASVSTLEELVRSGAFPAEIQLTVPKEPSSSQTIAPSEQSGKETSDAPSPSHNQQQSLAEAKEAAREDSISPVTRFRSRKPLSVTDLVSPAWCELQYSYSLHRHGRKRRTTAMKQGSVVHRKLEEEVHATFKVDVMTKEDAWGLRLWNVIQGARTLRETGMTRELEIWGLVGGQLVNGVIDELTYECPDIDLEMDGSLSEKEPDRRPQGGQQPIEDFFRSQSLSRDGPSANGRQPRNESFDDTAKVFLTDHKTRTVRSVPKGSAFKPTAMQLMIYRKLLASLVSDDSVLDPEVLWMRYNVNADTAFSQTFVDQFGEPSSSQDDRTSLPDTLISTSTSLQASDQSSRSFHTQATEPSALTISLDDLGAILRAHPTPRELWSRMIEELKRAIPGGLGNVLRVEYWDQAQSDRLGETNFLFDEKTLAAYLGRTMEWWEGKREAAGVDVADAWKCRGCEFAEICDWRRDKVEDAIKKYRQKAKK